MIGELKKKISLVRLRRFLVNLILNLSNSTILDY